jgi:hypothetical protein
MKTDTAQRTVVVGVFAGHSNAQAAIRELRSNNFADTAIGVASRHSEQSENDDEAPVGVGAGTGAAAGAAAGAGVGALWGLGVVAGLLPAIGPVIAGGTLAAILASTAIGAGAAGVGGALVGLGLSEAEAKHYESEFKAGRTIVSVKAVAGRYEQARVILERNGAIIR